MLVSRAFAIRNSRPSKGNTTAWNTLRRDKGLNTNQFNFSVVRTAPEPLTEEQYMARDATKFGTSGTNESLLQAANAFVHRIPTETSIIYECRLGFPPNTHIDNYVFLVAGTTENGANSQVVIELTREELVAGGLRLDEENKTLPSVRQALIRLTHTMERPY